MDRNTLFIRNGSIFLISDTAPVESTIFSAVTHMKKAETTQFSGENHAKTAENTPFSAGNSTKKLKMTLFQLGKKTTVPVSQPVINNAP
jgi:hypothetical protein